jgi:hypothetical protein
MNWHNTLLEIRAKLEDNGHVNVANDLFEIQLSGGTGGEIFEMLITQLIWIKKHDRDIYRIIASEIDSLIAYGISIGYLTEYDQ